MGIYLNMRGVTDGRQIIRGVKFLPIKIFEEILQTTMDFNLPYVITNKDIPSILEYYKNIVENTPRNEFNSYILDSISYTIIPSLKQELPRNDIIVNNEWYTVILE